MRRRTVLQTGLATAGLAALGPWPAALAQELTVPPPPGPPRPPTPVHTVDQTLPNGLRVLVAPRPGVALVSAVLLIRSGSEVDPPQRAGLADLTATLLTRGSAKRSAPEIARAAEALGGSLDGSAGWDRSRLAITVTPARLPAALQLLAEVARQPRFAPAELERARRQALDGLRVAWSEPGTLAQLVAARSLFGAGTYGAPRLGTPATLARLTRADLTAFHATWYRPDNAVLVLAGDLAPADALALAARTLGDWRHADTILPVPVRRAAVSTLPPVVVVDLPGAGQAGVVGALPAVPRAAPDYFAGVVANAVLGGSSSARLALEIRVRRGLTYDARSSLDARRVAGLAVAAVQTNNPSAPEVLGLLRAEVARLGQSAPEPAELAARVAYLVGAYGRSLETTAGLAARIAELALQGIAIDQVNTAPALLQAVSAEAVRRFAATHWPAGALRVANAGEAAQFLDSLRRAGPEVLVVPAAALDLEQPGLRK